MTTPTVTTRTCDVCKENIPLTEIYVNAITYGREAHLRCFEKLSALEVVKFLDLDEIKLMAHEDWEHARRLMDAALGGRR